MTVGAQVSTESPVAYLERYGLMLLIRLFETEMQRLFLRGEVHGTTHLCAGQEAVPVGVCSARNVFSSSLLQNCHARPKPSCGVGLPLRCFLLKFLQ